VADPSIYKVSSFFTVALATAVAISAKSLLTPALLFTRHTLADTVCEKEKTKQNMPIACRH
jgi:aspartate/glutamate racemase